MFFFIEKNKFSNIYILYMEVNTTSTTDPVNMYNYINNIVLNPIVFIIVFLVLARYAQNFRFDSIETGDYYKSALKNVDNHGLGRFLQQAY